MLKLTEEEKLSEDSFLLREKGAHLHALPLNLLQLLSEEAQREFGVVIKATKVGVSGEQGTTETVQQGGAKFWVGGRDRTL